METKMMDEAEKPRILQTEEERELNKLIFTELKDEKWGDNIVYRARKDGIEIFVGREKESNLWMVHVTTQLDYRKPCDDSLADAFKLGEEMFNETDDLLDTLV